MPDNRLVAFAATEEVATMIMGYDYKGHTRKEAEKLVKEGKARWELHPGAILSLEMNDA